jgi:putative membrane protein
MMWDNGWGAGQWVAMSLMMVLFWGLIIFAVVALVRSTRSEGHSSSAPPRAHAARRILDERFARGEIDAEEYVQRRDLLDRS